MSNTVTMKIEGKDIVVDLDAELEIHDVSEDQKRVAAQMGWWASVWAAAENERVRVDAFYRRWRAGEGKAILDKDPKLAEWKVRQYVEADPKFAKLKEALALANFDKGYLRVIQD